MTRGWPEYEGRWKRRRARPRHFREPLWDGADLEGKTIFRWCEQGLGEASSSSATPRSSRPAAATSWSNAREKLSGPVLREAGLCLGIDQLVPKKASSPFEYAQTPLLSLPGIFGTRRGLGPRRCPVPFSTNESVWPSWRDELPPQQAPNSVSASSGKATPTPLGPPPLVALEYFQPPAGFEDVQLFSLQKGVPPKTWSISADATA